MPKIMEIIEKETKGKSYHTYKYSYDSIGLPSIDYDDDPNTSTNSIMPPAVCHKENCRSLSQIFLPP